jgi:hypothetical protein
MVNWSCAYAPASREVVVQHWQAAHLHLPSVCRLWWTLCRIEYLVRVQCRGDCRLGTWRLGTTSGYGYGMESRLMSTASPPGSTSCLWQIRQPAKVTRSCGKDMGGTCWLHSLLQLTKVVFKLYEFCCSCLSSSCASRPVLHCR